MQEGSASSPRGQWPPHAPGALQPASQGAGAPFAGCKPAAGEASGSAPPAPAAHVDSLLSRETCKASRLLATQGSERLVW